ncbi:MAG: hypothetical protein GWM98_18205, partial [Nitrospinaceae bacterium]|nr:hypothetical protein [Nitrospinaceae bacterium]NIR56074.1 hypothetical protein [Nitrospinaceae bacterium]NIS86519.1 hypothetical protein [Nitrospinaceae bacterium]NIT83357.1 hypothetical protein [Nitrospinaceae bacterium]NIU97720.1 hypothetical protein [Nitrospinaceae bacterium]
EDFFVRAPLKSGPGAGGSLEANDNRVELITEPETLEIGIIPAAQFLKSAKVQDHPAADFMRLDGYCLHLYLCLQEKSRQLNLNTEEAVGLIRNAFNEGVADLVQLEMASCGERDRGFSQAAPLVQSIKKNFRTFVAWAGIPPEDFGVIDSFYAAGVDLIVLPLKGTSGEAPNPPSKQGMKMLEYAAGVFGPGTVRTELALNPGAIAPLLEQITALTQQGILPCITLPEGAFQQPDVLEQVRQVAGHLERSAQKEKLNLKWLYPSGGWFSPLDASFYTRDRRSARLAQRPVFQSTLGKTATEGFAALRRKLRIKNISDSYESAGL